MRITSVVFCALLLAGCSSGSDDLSNSASPSVAAKDVDVLDVLENRIVREAYDNAILLFGKARTQSEFDKVGDMLLKI